MYKSPNTRPTMRKPIWTAQWGIICQKRNRRVREPSFYVLPNCMHNTLLYKLNQHHCPYTPIDLRPPLYLHKVSEMTRHSHLTLLTIFSESKNNPPAAFPFCPISITRAKRSAPRPPNPAWCCWCRRCDIETHRTIRTTSLQTLTPHHPSIIYIHHPVLTDTQSR